MALVNVKYSDITNPIKTYILDSCRNIDSKYDNNVPLCFKAGYTVDYNQPHTCWTGGRHYRGCQYIPIVRYKITGKTVTKFTTAEVTNNFNQYLQDIGVYSKLNTIIPNNEFFDFIIAMMNYLSAHLVLFSSQFAPNTIRVFTNNNTITHNIDDLPPPLIRANTTEDLLKSLTQNMTSKIYNVVCQYKFQYVSIRNW